MAKAVPSHLDLDLEVAALVSRIGRSERPKSYMQGYNVSRVGGEPTIVTVTFIADEKFSQPAEKVEAVNLDSLYSEPWRCPHSVKFGEVCRSGVCGDESGDGVVQKADLLLKKFVKRKAEEA